jgi:hypothetical protein
VQLGDELGFDPAGLGLVVALYFGSAPARCRSAGSSRRWGGAVTSRIAVLGVAVVMLVLAVFADSYASLLAILLCGAWCNVMGQLASNLTLGGTTTGTFSGPLTGNVTGNASGSAASFTGSLSGDVTGTQGAGYGRRPGLAPARDRSTRPAVA